MNYSAFCTQKNRKGFKCSMWIQVRHKDKSSESMVNTGISYQRSRRCIFPSECLFIFLSKFSPTSGFADRWSCLNPGETDVMTFDAHLAPSGLALNVMSTKRLSFPPILIRFPLFFFLLSPCYFSFHLIATCIYVFILVFSLESRLLSIRQHTTSLNCPSFLFPLALPT